jgi:hypothetical protein
MLLCSCLAVAVQQQQQQQGMHAEQEAQRKVAGVAVGVVGGLLLVGLMEVVLWHSPASWMATWWSLPTR